MPLRTCDTNSAEVEWALLVGRLILAALSLLFNIRFAEKLHCVCVSVYIYAYIGVYMYILISNFIVITILEVLYAFYL
jgi:hypothetical protein